MVTLKTCAGAVVVGTGRLGRTSAPQHPISPNNLNTPLTVFVATHILYFVLVLILHAVACWQFLRTSGNLVGSVPIVITTVAPIAVVTGIGCATTMQYFSLL